MVKNTTIKVNLIFTFFPRQTEEKKKHENEDGIRVGKKFLLIIFPQTLLPCALPQIEVEMEKSRRRKGKKNFSSRAEDGSSAHLSWTHTPRSSPPREQAKAIHLWQQKLQIYHRRRQRANLCIPMHIGRRRRRKNRSSASDTFFLVFLVNINHLIVFFSGRSNRPVEIINVFVICEQFGVSIFSVFPLTLSGRGARRRSKKTTTRAKRRKKCSPDKHVVYQ
jgi:hypothetical protein